LSQRSFALECFANDGSFDLQMHYLYLRTRNMQIDNSSEGLDDLLLKFLIETAEQNFSETYQKRELKRSINLVMSHDGATEYLLVHYICCFSKR
jgi:hypothetical protein